MSKLADVLHKEFAARLDSDKRPTYVYTYPFKGAYRDLIDTQLVAKSWALASGRLNVYVHIPYCKMKCSFCHLFTTTHYTKATLGLYSQALLREIRIVASLGGWENREVDSLYFGGGTPSLISPEALLEIIRELRRHFTFRVDAEITIESAPNSVDKAILQNLVKVGFHRLSLGIQTFNPDELHAMGRRYEGELGCRLASAAICAGFQNVNVDLIYGLPGQTVKTWLLNLGTAISLGVPTISIYPLTVRAHTRFGRQYAKGPHTFPSSAEVYRLYDTAVDFLASRGYNQYSAAGFARPTGGNRHEVNEFSGIPTLGLGVAALSYSPLVHYTSGNYLDNRTAGTIAHYIHSVDCEAFPIRSGIFLDDDEARRRYVILGLLYNGFDRRAYQARFQDAVEAYFDVEIEVLRRERCIDEIGQSIMLSRRGRRASNLIAYLFASEKVKRLAESYR